MLTIITYVSVPHIYELSKLICRAVRYCGGTLAYTAVMILIVSYLYRELVRS